MRPLRSRRPSVVMPSSLEPRAAVPVALLLALACVACGGSRGYPGEPSSGVGGMDWRGAPAAGLTSSEGRPGAIPARAIKFAGMEGFASDFRGMMRRDRESLLGLPDAWVIYVFDSGGLVGATASYDGSVRAALVDALGEPHERTQEGPFTSEHWHGEVADVELRTGGQLDAGDVVLVSHREAIAARGD